MRGISELVTVLMLVLMAVMFASLTWFFLFKTTTDVSDISENITKQHQTQVGQKAKIENVLKNEVIIRNAGTSDLNDGDVVFFVENTKIDVVASPPPLKPDEFGKFVLNDAQLSMLPDPATLKVTTLGQGDEKLVDFYKKYYVAYWNFDDSSGNTTTDSSSFGNDGTCYGMGTSCNWTSGKYGSAIKFDGVDDYVNASTSSIVLNQFTFEAWINQRSILSGSAPMTVVNKGYFGPSLISAGLVMDGNRPGIYKNFSLAESPAPISLNMWTHLVGTYDGSTFKIYVNGVLKGSGSASGPVINTDAFGVSVPAGFGFGYFNGTIDEVRILNISRPM